MIDVVPMYEPRYYERSAQRYMARYLQNRLFINTPWGLSGSPASRPEIDAVALSGLRIILAKFGVSSRGEAAATAHRLRLFD